MNSLLDMSPEGKRKRLGCGEEVENHQHCNGSCDNGQAP